MKLHEKIVTHFLNSDTPIDKEGYLYKKGERNTSYQKRWCILKGNLLFYKDRPRDQELLGVVVLEGCSVQLCESEEEYAFSLVFSEPGLRTYKFAAEDQASQESWIKALLVANHHYLALLVRDLEKQYKAIKEVLPGHSHKLSTVIGPGIEKGSHSVSWLNSGSERNSHGHVAGAFVSSRLLQAPPTSSTSNIKKSPKLWPKRTAHVSPINGPSSEAGEWPVVGSFRELHENFGKEVKELIADWLLKGAREKGQLEGDLIHLD